MEAFYKSSMLLFVMLNPFLMSIYLLDLIESLTWRRFATVLSRASLISTAVFVSFAVLGDAIFSKVLQARFASFLIFGGAIFFLISVRFMMSGSEMLKSLRGDPAHLEGSVAMPFMIGPGTISASILAGSRLSPASAGLSIALAMLLVLVALLALKFIFDRVRERSAAMVDRYVDITGRLMALVMGTFSVEMIAQGIERLFLGK